MNPLLSFPFLYREGVHPAVNENPHIKSSLSSHWYILGRRTAILRGATQITDLLTSRLVSVQTDKRGQW